MHHQHQSPGRRLTAAAPKGTAASALRRLGRLMRRAMLGGIAAPHRLHHYRVLRTRFLEQALAAEQTGRPSRD